ncbi:MAG TPA: hypothetical protein VE961_14935 [Pyrinomonadaceae bacterium]|nr:hypothetical protein [Pyrinomonadaceae bacterium]
MKLRKRCFLLCLSVVETMIVVVVSGERAQAASESAIPAQKFAESNTRTAFHIKDDSFLIAYQDVVKILSEQNGCSDFFGGPEVLEVFHDLASQMTETYSNEPAAIRMHGRQTNVQRAGSSLRYRLFEKAEINGRGSFFRYGLFGEQPKTPTIGRFAPNTREARVLMLLHELGHLIEVATGRWLLPDDGNDPKQSEENTWTVMKHCEPAIRSLRA